MMNPPQQQQQMGGYGQQGAYGQQGGYGGAPTNDSMGMFKKYKLQRLV